MHMQPSRGQLYSRVRQSSSQVALYALPPLTLNSSCESQLRLCFLGDDLDSTLEDGLMSWHALCDDFVTFKPTTPALSQLTTSRNDDYCNILIRGACTQARTALTSCGLLTGEAAFSSCTCAPSLIILEYSCEFLGNTSCLATGATLSSLDPYSSCANFEDVVGTGVVSRPSKPV